MWITKYALTQGIFNLNVYHCVEINKDMVSYVSAGMPTYYYKPDWYLTKEEAVTRAETMRAKKISSLHKSVQKLDSLKF